MSRAAPVMLSSSGAVVSEAQPDANQATAIRLVMNFIGLLCSTKVEKPLIPQHLQCCVAGLRLDFGTR